MTVVNRLVVWLWKVLPLPPRLRWIALWSGNTKYLIGAVGVVFDEAERVLLVEHTYRRRHPWGLPGGWIGRRERLEDALARELLEETGLAVTVGPVFFVRSGYRHPHIDIYFVCRYDGLAAPVLAFRPNAEIAAIRFCPLDDLPARMPPHQRPIIARALALFRAWS